MQQLLSDEYLAGHWRGRLPYELLWSLGGNSASGQIHTYRPKKYIDPSWPWASVEGFISYPEEIWDVYMTLNRDGECLSVLEAEVTYLDTNQTGQVSRGFLRVQGMLGTITWTWNDAGPSSLGGVASLHITNGSPLTARSSRHKRERISFWIIDVGNEDETFSRVEIDDMEGELSPGTAFLLPIYIQSSNYLHSIDGLLLRKLASGEFQRIGRFCIGDEKIDEIYDSLDEQVIVIV